MTVHNLADEGRIPFLIVDVSEFGQQKSTNMQVMFYGHMDKQPYGPGWNTDPCEPVIKNGKLFGRGSVDDGYAFFTAISAIKACQITGKGHPRCIIVIEGSEEGEIHDLIHYMGKYKHLLGEPSVVICLDTFAASPKSMSITCSLRGSMTFDISVRVATNNMHSGIASGICPNPFQIIMSKLEKL
jgi:acetylornithine deacetylase/succinyl-diaminopimelate desuccinylase-like protein